MAHPSVGLAAAATAMWISKKKISKAWCTQNCDGCQSLAVLICLLERAAALSVLFLRGHKGWKAAVEGVN